MHLRSTLVYALLLAGGISCAQTVSPVISDFIGKAEGRIALSNHTADAMAVMLEPRSFSIAPDGTGLYRSLDPQIHVELSSVSFRLEPGQMQYVYYKARADRLPAWFTISSTFSAIGHRSNVDLRILLPHTVYIHSKKKPVNDDIVVTQATYSSEARKIICQIANNTLEVKRVGDIRFTSESKAITSPGFPLLPGATRHLEVNWEETDPPREIVIHVDRSTVNRRLSATD